MAPTDLILKAPKWFKDLLIVCMVAALAFLGSQWLASRDVSHAVINESVQSLSTDLEKSQEKLYDHDTRITVLEKMIPDMDKKLDTIIRLHLKNGERR